MLRLILSSLSYFRGSQLAIGLGVLVATAVLTGALLVGDSVRASLRAMALDQLQRIDEVLVVEQFFRAALADELAAQAGRSAAVTAVVPATLLNGTVEATGGRRQRRASQVTIVGADARFWKLANEKSSHTVPMSQAGVVVNRTLADELGVQVGDTLLVRLPLPTDLPADSPLGKKSDLVEGRRWPVTAIVPSDGLAAFSLRRSQRPSRNLFVPLKVLQRALDLPGRANTLLVAGDRPAHGTTVEQSRRLQQALAPRLTDYRLALRPITIGDPRQPVSQRLDLSSRRLMLPPAVVRRAQEAFPADQLQMAFSYLANTIRAGQRSIPYSIVTGINPRTGLGPFETDDGRPLADDEVILNSWAADQLKVQPGDEVTLTYYLPESTHGVLQEGSPATFRVRSVIPLATKGEPPTQANDPDLTPRMPGVTDQRSIDDWELPFTLVEKIRPEDEAYWDDHRATPKAFVSLKRARMLWQSRFGDTTSLRFPVAPDQTAADVQARLKLNPAELGFKFRPVKRLALASAVGTTPFEFLFLGFSGFLMVSALMLVALLFRLGIQRRAVQMGLFQAVGFSSRRWRRLLVIEHLLVASAGAIAGALAGVAFAWLMLVGLGTLWQQAVSTSALRLAVHWPSVATGAGLGWLVCVLTIGVSLRRLGYHSPRALLAGTLVNVRPWSAAGPRWSRALAALLLVCAVFVAGGGTWLSGEGQAGAFLAAGSLTLTALLLLVWRRMRMADSTHSQAARSLFAMAGRNAARNPGRSLLAIGLVASASFLLIAIGAFRLAPTVEGTGGFQLWATSDQAVLFDLNTESGRNELGFSTRGGERLADWRTYALRVQAGDDASCLNLYQSRGPRVLGLPSGFLARGGFAWAGSLARSPTEQANPWTLLERPIADGAIPVVLDAATATYGLKIGLGDRYQIDGDDGQPVKFLVVGLLRNSIFQGDLLVAERHFLSQFPKISGHRLFLLEGQKSSAATAANDAAQITEILERTLGDLGFDVTRADDRLRRFLDVQNTYLLTFQSLGGLGLLLGTLGLAAAQLRAVVERRGELAVMRACGFSDRRLVGLVMLENGSLLVIGLGIGSAAALVAVAPRLVVSGGSLPGLHLAGLLAAILAAGWLAAWIAARQVLRLPLLQALRAQ